MNDLLYKGGLQTAEAAESVMERLQKQMVTLRQAAKDADELGDDPAAYLRSAEGAAALLVEVQKQLAASTWQPLKLSDSVDVQHGSLIRSVDRALLPALLPTLLLSA